MVRDGGWQTGKRLGTPHPTQLRGAACARGHTHVCDPFRKIQEPGRKKSVVPLLKNPAPTNCLNPPSRNGPASDVAQQGGWKNISVVQQVYQQADDETLLRVLSEPRELRDVSAREPQLESPEGAELRVVW